MKETRSHSKVRAGWFCACIGIAAVGCGAPADRAAEQGEGSSDLVKTTVVSKDDQGKPVVRAFYQTKEQAARELAARLDRTKRRKEGLLASESEDIIYDDGCANSSLWLWSQTYAGGPRCCLAGAGYDWIEPYCGYDEIKSFYPGEGSGSHDGMLSTDVNCHEDFYADGEMVNVSYCYDVVNVGPNFVTLYP